MCKENEKKDTVSSWAKENIKPAASGFFRMTVGPLFLMTAPPMTAEQHAEVMRKRIAHRRMVEEARELKRASSSHYDNR